MNRPLLLILVALLPMMASAYDAETGGIYYNFSGDEAEVTYRDANYNSYSGAVTIPESVTYSGKTYSVISIGAHAFEKCTNLVSITIPESVKTIGSYTFQNCSELSLVTIPHNVTSIGSSAFNNCSGLTSITIPNSVISIGGYAFYDCTSLIDVYCYAENTPSTSSDAFENSSFSSATLHVPAGSVSAYKAKYPWNAFRRIVAIE